MKLARKLGVAVLLLALLCSLAACNNGVIPGVSGDDDVNAIATDEEPQIGIFVEITPLIVRASETDDLKKAIVELINKTDFSCEEEELIYSQNRIAELKEFYFQEVEIEGFELDSVAIHTTCITFEYVSLNPNDWYYSPPIDDYLQKSGKSITISMRRPCHPYFRCSKESFENLKNANSHILIEGNLLYSVSGNSSAVMGDTLLTIYVPDGNIYTLSEEGELITIPDPKGINTPDFLRALTLQVMETAELVQVR